MSEPTMESRRIGTDWFKAPCACESLTEGAAANQAKRMTSHRTPRPAPAVARLRKNVKLGFGLVGFQGGRSWGETR
jgi:hypothetical protein